METDHRWGQEAYEAFHDVNEPLAMGLVAIGVVAAFAGFPGIGGALIASGQADYMLGYVTDDLTGNRR